MATYRIGISSEFSLDAGVGIGTATPGNGLGDLRVDGTYKTEDLDVLGVSTLSRYAGFAAEKINIDTSRDVTLTGEHQTIGDIVVGVNSTFTVSVAATVDIGTVPSVSIGTHFSPPTGGVEDRLEVPVEGTVRFNEDLNTLEFYNGAEWRQFTSWSSQGARAVISGGYGDQQSTPQGQRKEIQWFNTTTQGNTQYFGDLTDYALPDDSCGNTIRILNSHGTKAGLVNIIDYVTIASTGDAIDFGDTTGSAHARACAIPSSTRGIWAGGMTPSAINIIDYVEIMQIGNSLDFGDITSTRIAPAGGSNGTRGVIAGGYSTTTPYPVTANGYTSDIQTITIASKGNSTSWGNLSYTGGYADCAYNNTRALFAGGYGPVGPFRTKRMCSLITASGGQAFDFGELHVIKAFPWGAGTGTRGFFGGGNAWPSQTHYNQIEYVSIHSLGNPIDFGDMTTRAYAAGGITNAHGGLGGF